MELPEHAPIPSDRVADACTTAGYVCTKAIKHPTVCAHSFCLDHMLTGCLTRTHLGRNAISSADFL